MKNNKKYIIISFGLAIIFMLSTTVMATNSSNYNKLLLGLLQANEHILGGEQTLSMNATINPSNPLTVNIEAHDTTYNIVSLKWISGEVSAGNFSVFDAEDANEITITSGKDVTASFDVPAFGIYSVCATNDNGNRYATIINVQYRAIPTVTITKDEANKRNITIVAESEYNTIDTIKYAKKDTKDAKIDFTTQGTEIEITPAKKVTVQHSFEEDGIYAVYVKDSQGNYMINTIYAYKDFPIQENITAEGKTLNISVTATLSNISEIRITNTVSKEEKFLEVTPAKTINTSYEVTEYGSYSIEITDEIGFKKQVDLILQEQVEQLPIATITYSPATATNGTVTATITFDKEGVTITNNGGNNTYTFTENDNFTFEYTTALGTKLTQLVSVDWIKPVSIQKTYSIINENSVQYIKDIAIGTTGKSFLNNIDVIDANYKVYDALDNEILETDKLATGMVLKNENEELKLIVTGDINGDGELTLTDISNLKLHIVELNLLTNESLYAADTNKTNTVTLTDLSQLKTMLLNL